MIQIVKYKNNRKYYSRSHSTYLSLDQIDNLNEDYIVKCYWSNTDLTELTKARIACLKLENKYRESICKSKNQTME